MDDPPQAAWKKLLEASEALMADLDEPESAERNAAALAVPLGIEPPPGGARRRRRPRAHAGRPHLFSAAET